MLLTERPRVLWSSVVSVNCLPLVYAQLAPAMAHLAPEMGRANLFSLFAFMSKLM